jgi:hypothetical protein
LEQVTRFYMRGSARDGSMHGGAVGLETTVHVRSPEDPDKIRHLIRMGEQTCFTLGALVEHTPTETAATLNGEPLALTEEVRRGPAA